MLQRGSWAVALIAALVMAVGAGSAWGTGLRVRAGKIGGVAKPVRIPTGAARNAPALAGLPGASGSGSGAGGTSPGGGAPPLLYAGGPVMHGVTTHVVAWAPAGYSFPSGYVSGYETFLSDLGQDLGQGGNVSSVAGQYVDSEGSALSSLTNDPPISDATAYPASGGCTVSGASACLTESQLLNEVGNVISAHALPADENQSYIVLLPPGVDSCYATGTTQCEDNYFCGYHDFFSIGGANTTFTLLPYTESSYSNSGGGVCYDPSVTYPAGSPSDLMALDSLGAHELVESATDPIVNSGYADAQGDEVADECAYFYTPTSSAPGGGIYNQLLNGNQYLIQDMWSNQDNGCVQGVSSTSSASVTTAASAVVNTATSLTASLSGASPTGASYEWSYAKVNGVVHPSVASGANPHITFTSTGTYTVWVQVTDAAGGTITGVADVVVSSAASPLPAFGYTTSTTVPATGSPVSFTSSASASSSQSITSTSWDFGDGTTSSGSSVSHTYAAAGTYTVTCTAIQTNGRSAQLSKDLTVVNPPSANISWSGPVVAGTGLTFSGATAGAGELTSYSWSFGDGSTSTAASPSHTYASPGTYTVTLTLTQTDGLSATAQRSVTVTATPPPTAAFGYTSQTSAPTTDSPVSFTSTSGAYGSQAIELSSWDFGDGASGSGSQVSHTFSAPGTYTVTLTVTQTNGETAQTSETVTVTAAPTGSTGSTGGPGAPGSGGSTGTSGSPGSGGSTGAPGPGGPIAPSGQSVSISWLSKVIAAGGARLRITSLLKKNGITDTVNSATGSGRLVITWYATVKHHKVVVARGTHAVASGATARIWIKLTRPGRALLARSKRLKITVSGSFRSGPTDLAATTLTLTLRR